jgi:alpha-ketoglutarate-dependent taurine dioxygenase
MKSDVSTGASFSRFQRSARQRVGVNVQQLGAQSLVSKSGEFPLKLEPSIEAIDPIGWMVEARDDVTAMLFQHGAILFRNFGIEDANRFQQFVEAFSPNTIDYIERAAPRTKVAQKVFTSTEFSPDHPIPLHHEMSYSHNWPAYIFFYCSKPPSSGGATPIARETNVLPKITPKVRERFESHGVMYVRNYSPSLDVSWQDAFQTDDPRKVAEYCTQFDIRYEWIDAEHLRTRQIRQAIAAHPHTGEVVWFNHAHLFHVSNLDFDSRNYLLESLGMDRLPRNAFYGDGSPIEDTVLDEIRGLYNSTAVEFEWLRGDVMLVDNFLAAHGRAPFKGERQILVAMSDLFVNPTFATLGTAFV